MICNNCGANLPEGSNVCSMCGTVLVPSVPQANKPKSKLPIIIIVAVVLAVGVFAGGLLLGKTLNKSDEKEVDKKEESKQQEKLDDSSKDKDKDEEKKYSYNKFDGSKVEITYGAKEELSKNIEILGYYRNDMKEPDKYERVQIYGRNNNSEPVDLDLALQYFDNTGVRLGEGNDSGNNMVKANSEFVISVDLMDDSENYSSVKLVIEATKKPSYVTDVEIKPEDISLTTLKDGNIEVYIKNNSGQESMYGNGGFLFYKEGKLVYASSGYFDTHIPVGGTSKGTFYNHEISNGKFGDEKKTIEYDDVKFIVFSLYFSDEQNY